MTTHSNKHDDTRILLAVAGVVVAGAAGLALLVGLGSDPGASRAAATRPAKAQRLQPAERRDAEPAMLAGPRETGQERIETAGFGAASGRAVTPEIAVTGAPVPEAFRIEPGENLVAGGLEAWNRGKYDRAAAYFDAQTQARDSDAWAHYMLGLSRWKAGAADDAVVALERSAELDPGFIRTPINLARIQNDRGDFEAALSAVMGALAIDPDDAQARFLEGRSLFNLGRAAEAVVALEQSIAADGDNGYVHNLLGLVLLTQGESARAADVLERAAELEPSVAFIHNNLGMAAEHCGERETAIAAYRRAVELNAGHAKAARNLARLQPGAAEGTADSVAGVVQPPSSEIVETASAGSLN